MAIAASEFPTDDLEPRLTLWDVVERRFHGPSLRHAMVARGLTIHGLAALTGDLALPGRHGTAKPLAPETIIKARRGARVDDATAIKILAVLDQHPPMGIVDLER